MKRDEVFFIVGDAEEQSFADKLIHTLFAICVVGCTGTTAYFLLVWTSRMALNR
jgi:hypothetical protein